MFGGGGRRRGGDGAGDEAEEEDEAEDEAEDEDEDEEEDEDENEDVAGKEEEEDPTSGIRGNSCDHTLSVLLEVDRFADVTMTRKL